MHSNVTSSHMGASLHHPSSAFEAHWQSFFTNASHPGLLLAVSLFAWHELVFFGRFFPYYLMDQIPYFQQYKIQETKPNTPGLYRKCLISVIKSQLFVQAPMMLLFHPTAMYLGMKFLDPFPALSTVVMSCIFCLIVEDAYHYWVHRLMHHPKLYRHVHKIHHEFQAPFGITAEHAHPIEVLVLGQGFFLGPVILLLAGVDMHVITMAAWLALRLLETVDVHAGYDFPWSLHKLLPFLGGAEFHDYHHMAFVGNYSSSFRWWDWMFGTDRQFEAWKAKTQAAKRSIVHSDDPAAYEAVAAQEDRLKVL
ncbi:C-4 sterol methyl oxidase [Thoreauomyces humboldtii]|nr:C-4 sterol methyl oxidase [Thoreauomyces humboldtii]